MANEQYSQAMEYLNDMEDKKVANQQTKKYNARRPKVILKKRNMIKQLRFITNGEKKKKRER